MASKTFDPPFAESGNKSAIPNTTQPSGDVSYPEGWGPDYERDQATDPLAKDVERQKENQFKFDVTEFLKEVQQNGIPVYNANYNYPVGAYTLASDGILYQALVANGPLTTIRNPIGDTTGSWISNRGDVREYSNTFDYTPDDYVKGSDGNLYRCAADNGPSSSIFDPITGFRTFWAPVRSDIKNWDNSFVYRASPSNDYAKGSDGVLYLALVDNGPTVGPGVVDPVNDTSGTWMRVGGSLVTYDPRGLSTIRDSSVLITMRPGSVRNWADTFDLRLTANYQKDLNTTWTDGGGAGEGGLAEGVSIGGSGWLRRFIARTGDGGPTDVTVFWDTSPTAANFFAGANAIAAGFTNSDLYRRVGWNTRTSTLSYVEPIDDPRRTIWSVPKNVLSVLSVSSAARVVLDFGGNSILAAPFDVQAKYNVLQSASAGSDLFMVSETPMPDVAVTVNRGTFGTQSNSPVGAQNHTSWIGLDSSGQSWIRSLAASTFVLFELNGAGWRDSCLVA